MSIIGTTFGSDDGALLEAVPTDMAIG